MASFRNSVKEAILNGLVKIYPCDATKFQLEAAWQGQR